MLQNICLWLFSFHVCVYLTCNSAMILSPSSSSSVMAESKMRGGVLGLGFGSGGVFGWDWAAGLVGSSSLSYKGFNINILCIAKKDILMIYTQTYLWLFPAGVDDLPWACGGHPRGGGGVCSSRWWRRRGLVDLFCALKFDNFFLSFFLFV